jgi:hypothetical protein
LRDPLTVVDQLPRPPDMLRFFSGTQLLPDWYCSCVLGEVQRTSLS